MQLRYLRHSVAALLILAAGIVLARDASADQDVNGVISARGNDGTLTLRTDDATTMILVMNEASKVRQVDGMRQVRHGSRTLIPGLRVQVSGVRQGSNRFIVNRITFERPDLKMALASGPTH